MHIRAKATDRLIVLDQQDLIAATGWVNLTSANLAHPVVPHYVRQYVVRKLNCDSIQKIRIMPSKCVAVVKAGLV